MTKKKDVKKTEKVDVKIDGPSQDPEAVKKLLIDQSAQLGTNMQAFLERVNLSARTVEDRRVLQVFSGVCEVAEKLATGELVLINASQLFTQAPPLPDDGKSGKTEE